MRTFVRAFANDASGTVATEYALLGSLIAMCIVGAFAALGGMVDTYFTAVETSYSWANENT